MPRTLRFHLDENVDPAVADGVRRRGIDVTTAPDAGLLGAEDSVHLDFIRDQGRVLFTHDNDFLKLHAQGLSHPGMPYCRQHSRSTGEIIRGLEFIWEVLEPDDVRDKVEFL